MLLEQARLPAAQAEATNKLAASLAEKLRNQKSAGACRHRPGPAAGVFAVVPGRRGADVPGRSAAAHPDKGTRDALIRDKISTGNWQPHLGNSPSLFVNAATWGLLLTGKLVSTHNESGLTSSLTRIIGKSGEPMIRKGVDMAMRLMGEQFVTGETIAEALANASKFEAKGFRYSYDMLGEAALTEHDAIPGLLRAGDPRDRQSVPRPRHL
jgi:RHH-type proline utilization regulon transcriptional repressor/proline dehydrogenase/delta 1-pyrroline-5-carboxylate dehydrogenase